MNIVELQKLVQGIYEDLLDNAVGEVANYIPQLGTVNPDIFGISICTVNGDMINIGDTTEHFCIQSCSKPLSYCIARQENKDKDIHAYVGYEPSGRSFNAFQLNNDNIPHNPLINTGAIMIASLIEPNEEPSRRFELINKYYQKLCGGVGKLGFDNSVFLSEQHHADRNISLAYYMRENKAFDDNVGPKEIEKHLNLYFQSCSITINSQMGASITATLANAGTSPITGENVFKDDVTRDCLSLMYMCGMYDYSGQFAFKIGLPGKSGVSGCLFLVVPNKMGICIWSPRLDKMGNSVRGVEFCKEFIKRYPIKLHIFHTITCKDMNNDSNEFLQQRLISACASGNTDIVHELISKIDINKGDYDYRTPLHLASAEGHVNIVEILLNNNAKVNPKDRWGNTPLHEVSINMKKDISRADEYTKIKNLLEDYLEKESDSLSEHYSE